MGVCGRACGAGVKAKVMVKVMVIRIKWFILTNTSMENMKKTIAVARTRTARHE
jgi:hypothetical protein